MKCIKCKKKICKDKSKYYQSPLNQMCVDCRSDELKRMAGEIMNGSK